MPPDQRPDLDPVAETFFATAGPRRRRRRLLLTQNALARTSDFASLYVGSMCFGPSHLHKPPVAKHSASSPGAERFLSAAAALFADTSVEDLISLRQRSLVMTSWKRRLQVAMMRNPGKTPEIHVEGSPQAEVTASGRPVIYWLDNTLFAELVGRMAMARLPRLPVHFSDWVHEHGETWLGHFALQRPIFRLEQRYVGPRITSNPSTHVSATRALHQLMRQGGNLFTMNNAFLGRRFACTPVTPGLCFVQATGVLNMAWKFDALIVPVTVLQIDPLTRYQVTFHSPLTPDRRLSRDAAIARMAEHSVRRSLAAIREHPEQWLCWISGQLVQASPGQLERRGM